MEGEYAIYKAVQVAGVGPVEVLEFQKNDILEVPVEPLGEVDEKIGYIYAYNRRTGAEGYVPVECVKLLGSQVNNTLHHPSAPGLVEDPKNDGHQLVEVYFVRPVLCDCCGDYIWGSGRVGTSCKGKCFHVFWVFRSSINEFYLIFTFYGCNKIRPCRFFYSIFIREVHYYCDTLLDVSILVPRHSKFEIRSCVFL